MKILGITIPWTTSYTPPVYGETLMPGPHCDPLIVHAPGDCSGCDEFSMDAQVERIHRGVNFTGGRQQSRVGCPAEAKRSLEQIHAWHGNRPIPRTP